MLAMPGPKVRACAWLRVAAVLLPRRLSRPEGRRAPIQSAIGWQSGRRHPITQIDHDTCATDLDDQVTTEQGYTIRHIETWHRYGHSDTVILWDTPSISEADLSF
jgi:hypothetical protein